MLYDGMRTNIQSIDDIQSSDDTQSGDDPQSGDRQMGGSCKLLGEAFAFVQFQTLEDVLIMRRVNCGQCFLGFLLL
jgi:hypothetical protein